MIDYSSLAYRVESMKPDDIQSVMEIETVSFSAPWSARAYDYELHYNEMAHYSVVRPQDGVSQVNPVAPPPLWRRLFGRARGNYTVETLSEQIIGYGGFWLMVDEAHISTIATHPKWRRRGVGELLLLSMIGDATAVGARWVTLEVRLSNVGAQTLYSKYGFEVAGERKNYYSDNGEDALIMTTPLLTSIEYQSKIQGLKDALVARLAREPV